MAEHAFLGVERSLSGRMWRARLTDDRLALAISQRHDLPEILGRVLASRDVALEDVASFLSPTLRELMPAPSLLADMEKGSARIARGVMAGERIGIIGDYDVDGVTSTALITQLLRGCGIEPSVHIPDRITEGYGPSRAAVTGLKEKGCTLLITLDCGVMAHDPLLLAQELGMDTVIVDHHQAGEELPEAEAVINPNRQDDVSGYGYMSAVGVALVLAAVLLRDLRGAECFTPSRPAPDLLALLDLVALGTVCDVVPLKGLNRAFVTQGLKVMGNRGNLGLSCLADVARLKRRPDPYALGFVMGPRLNAAGRVGSAMLAFELLTANDKGRAMELAQKLEEMNRERQSIELRVVEQAAIQAEQSLGETGTAPLLIVSGNGWHPGVLGLAASRLKERFGIPAIALGINTVTGLATGSGRSISGVDLGGAVRAAMLSGLLVKGGGHAMAAGMTVEAGKIGAFRAFMEERLAAETEKAAEGKSLMIDAALSASGCKADLVHLLERAGPYGAGNPNPVFALPNHRVAWADGAGSDHVRCALTGPDGTRLKAIAFRALNTPMGEMLLNERQKPVHLAGRIQIDDWGGKGEVQLLIEDAAEPV